MSANTGYKGYKVLEEYYPSDSTPTGRIKPNLTNNSPQDFIDGTVNSITYNYPTDVAPTGGIDGDIWYNPVADEEYKKISGVWTLLTDRVTNPDYVAPVIDHDVCPLP